MSATRTPTVEEWYGASYTPTFPDDDGEEMRRVSSRKPVSQAEYDAITAEADALRALLVAAEELINERANPAPDYTFRAMLHKRLEEAASKARTALSTATGRETP